MDGVTAEQDKVASFVDRAIMKLMYKPFGMAATVAAAMLASAIFGRIWRTLAGEKHAPGATDKSSTWADIVPPAALHGLVFGIVKALMDRETAKQFERITGRWPGSQTTTDNV